MNNTRIYDLINELAIKYSKKLSLHIDSREQEMKADSNSHHLIYRVLGISDSEGQNIDLYQNKGRFLYKYAGSFLEEAALICFCEKDSQTQTHVWIPNSLGTKPRRFEIDCLSGNNAYEIKWRDATTDGDHITKEHMRIKVIQKAGYTPIRVMFYYPNRLKARNIQDALQILYHSVGGQYYYDNSAWDYIRDVTGVNLLEILTQIADSKTGESHNAY